MKLNTHYDPHHIDRLEALRGKPLAGFWRRGIALSIDFVFCTFLVFLGILIYAIIAALIHHRKTTGISIEGEGAAILFEFIVPITYAGLIIYFTQGKTLGKLITGIRVVPITHERITLLHSIERSMAYATSVLEFGFGFLQYFMNPNHRTLCDKVGETIVIKDRISKSKSKEDTFDYNKLEMVYDEDSPAPTEVETRLHDLQNAI